MKRRVLLSWSGGRDSAMALLALQGRADLEVVGLLTTITKQYDRITMHGVRRTLLERQAEEVGIELMEVLISREGGEEEYCSRMRRAMLEAKSRGISGVAFGDIFLEDVRSYREERLREVEMESFFPLWGSKTAELASRFIEKGFQAIVVSVDSRRLGRGFVGRLFDRRFLQELPGDVDPCGEKGEFHSFVFAGPLFRKAVPFRRGGVVLREGFYFCDLLLCRAEKGCPKSPLLREGE